MSRAPITPRGASITRRSALVGCGSLLTAPQLLRAQKVEGTPQENLEAAEQYLAAVKKILGK